MTDTKPKQKTSQKEVTMATKDLRDALLKANNVSRCILPVPSQYTRIDFGGDKALVTTTNLEQAARISIDCDYSTPFSALLPKKTTEKFLHDGEGKVILKFIEQSRKITMSRDIIGDFNIWDIPKIDDFPPLPFFSAKLNWHKFDADWLCRMLRFVSNACATEPSRPVLMGICCSDNAIAAADGFRLNVLKDSRLFFGLGDEQAIIPLPTIELALKLFRKEKIIQIAFESAETQVGMQKKRVIERVHFKSNGTILVSNLTQGSYPKYTQLVPDKFNCKVSFSAPLMVQRLKTIDPIVSEITRFSFSKTKPHGEHECTIETRAEEVFQYLLKLPVKISTESEGRIAFNLQYVLDAIKVFSMCDLEISSPASPGKFTGDIEGLTVVVMPMFVQW